MDAGQALLNRITELSAQLFEDVEPQQAYNRIAQIALAELQADCASLMLWDAEARQLTLAAAAGMSREMPERLSGSTHGDLADWVMRQRAPLLTPGDDAHLPDFNGLLGSSGVHSVVGAPLLIHDRSLGMLWAMRQQNRLPFTLADRDLLVLLAGQSALAITSVQRQRQAQRRVQRLDRLGALAATLSAQPDLDRALRLAAEQIGAAAPGSRGYLIWRAAAPSHAFQAFPIGDAAPLSAAEAGADAGMFGRLLAAGAPQIVRGSDTAALAAWERQILRDDRQALVGSALTVDDRANGALLLAGPPGAPFGEADLAFLDAAAALVARAAAQTQAAAQAARALSHYRALFDHANEALLLIAPDTLQIVEANRAAEALSGYTAREAIGMPAARLLPGDLFDRRSRALAQVHAGAHPEIDAHLRTRAGRDIPVAVRLSAIGDGADRYLLLSARDASERQRAAQRFAQTEKLAGMGRLATSIAHEINNPLQAIHNSLHLVVNRPLSEEKRDRYLLMAHEEVERLITLVQRMLDFYRPSRDGMRPISLHAILENVLSMTAEQFREADIVIDRRWDERLPWVKGIGPHIKQVFLNLALNAIEAMPDGGRLTISTRVEAAHMGLAERYVLVEFSDTGPGIPAHEAETIFEPFYSTKHAGPGLGLAISYSIIERHEGALSVSSSANGTTFRVALPAIEGSELAMG